MLLASLLTGTVQIVLMIHATLNSPVDFFSPLFCCWCMLTECIEEEGKDISYRVLVARIPIILILNYFIIPNSGYTVGFLRYISSAEYTRL